MKEHSSRQVGLQCVAASFAAALLVGMPASAQQPAAAGTSAGAAAGVSAPGPAAGATGPTTAAGMPTGGTGFGPGDPVPYYLGVSQGFTHESNVYRAPTAVSDTYSRTSLLGGLDQRIGRQRLFGSASVSANRYFKERQLDNTGYALAAGLDWETINKLSGNLRLGLNQNLSAPAAGGVVPAARRNIAQTESISATARYGGASLLTLEGTVGYSQLEYSDPAYVSSESRGTSASLGVYYRPGGPLRLGVAGRVTSTRIPRALFDPALGTYQSNTVDGQNLDFTADYRLSGIVDGSARLSYTRQSNSNAAISGADFSGLTGTLNVAYRVTGKTSLNLSAGREAGVTSSAFNGYVIDVSQPTPVRMLQSGIYQYNQVTNYIGLTASHATTGKTTLNGGLRYSRAKLLTSLVTTSGATANPDTVDVAKVAFVGLDHSISAKLGLSCSVSREDRDISGGIAPYGYTANSIGCMAQYTWR